MIRNKNNSHSRGFTIVELIVVIAVIGILAAIGYVMYGGAQERAREGVLSSDLSAAAELIGVDKVRNGQYPEDISDVDNGNGLPASADTTYRYGADNTTNPPTFCLTGINGQVAMFVTESTTPKKGTCPGHPGPVSDSDESDPGSDPEPEPEGPVIACSSLSIGDTGPGDGIIFFKDTSKTPAVCYEAAPAGWYPEGAPYDAIAEWGCYGTDIPGADNMAIGAGRQNTADILAAHCTPSDPARPLAAAVATDYRGGGKSDWYLPSAYELNEMYKRKGTIGGFMTANYWSSSEYTSSRTEGAWVWLFAGPDGQSAPTGYYGLDLKRHISMVRPIRSFSE